MRADSSPILCAVNDCAAQRTSRGYCERHYQAWYRHGDPTVRRFVRGDDAARFLSHVVVDPGGCHLWSGARDKDGYGKFRFGVSQGQRMGRAHVYAWEQVNGRVPAGKVLDHFVCDTTSCVNAAHVRPVSNRENILRGRGLAAINLAKTACPRGHPYNAENTLRTPDDRRYCLACQRLRS